MDNDSINVECENFSQISSCWKSKFFNNNYQLFHIEIKLKNGYHGICEIERIAFFSPWRILKMIHEITRNFIGMNIDKETRKYHLLGKNKYKVYETMRGYPDREYGNRWYYILDVSWFIRRTILIIDFEDDTVQYIGVRVLYVNPLRGIKDSL
ncbi:MAG: hypothetical protein ACN6OG_02105 [Chryseobacterium rhizosphaerae]